MKVETASLRQPPLTPSPAPLLCTSEPPGPRPRPRRGPKRAAPAPVPAPSITFQGSPSDSHRGAGACSAPLPRACRGRAWTTPSAALGHAQKRRLPDLLVLGRATPPSPCPHRPPYIVLMEEGKDPLAPSSGAIPDPACRTWKQVQRQLRGGEWALQRGRTSAPHFPMPYTSLGQTLKEVYA